MTTVFRKYLTLVPIVLLLAGLIFAWLFPAVRSILGVIILLFSLAIASFAVFGTNREAYLQGRITRVVFIRNVLVEIIGILLAMILAGLLGRYIAQIAAEWVSGELIKQIAAIVIGLLTGIVSGLLFKYIWGRLVH